MINLLKLHIIQRYFKRYLLSLKFNRIRIYSTDLYHAQYKNNINTETLFSNVIKISSYSLIFDYIILKNMEFQIQKLFELIVLEIYKKQYSQESIEFREKQLPKTLLDKYFDISALELQSKTFYELKTLQRSDINHNSDNDTKKRFNPHIQNDKMPLNIFFLALNDTSLSLKTLLGEGKESSLALKNLTPPLEDQSLCLELLFAEDEDSSVDLELLVSNLSEPLQALEDSSKVISIRQTSTITDLDTPCSLNGNDTNVEEQQDSFIRGENKTGAGSGLLIPVLDDQSLGLEDLFAEDENSSLALKNFAPRIQQTAPEFQRHYPMLLPIRKASTITDLEGSSSLDLNDNNGAAQQDNSIAQQEIEIDLENLDDIPQLLANEESQIYFVEESISPNKDFTPKKNSLEILDDDQSFSPQTTPFLDKEFQQNAIEENDKEQIIDFIIQFSTPKKNLSEELDSDQSFTASISPFLDRKSYNTKEIPNKKNHHKDKIINQSSIPSKDYNNNWNEDWCTNQYPEFWDNAKNILDYSTDSDHKISRRPQIAPEESLSDLNLTVVESDISLILEKNNEEAADQLDRVEEESEFIKKWKKSFELNNKRLKEWQNSYLLQNPNLQEIDQIKEKVLPKPIHPFPKKTSQPKKTQTYVKKEESSDMILGRMEREAGMFFNMNNPNNNGIDCISDKKNPIIQNGYCFEYQDSDDSDKENNPHIDNYNKIDDQFLF